MYKSPWPRALRVAQLNAQDKDNNRAYILSSKNRERYETFTREKRWFYSTFPIWLYQLIVYLSVCSPNVDRVKNNTLYNIDHYSYVENNP